MNRWATLFLTVIYHAVVFQTSLVRSETKIIESFHIKSDIRYRFATTQIESVVRNTADRAQEISFSVTLPKEAFIVSFSMKIDGKVYDGEVKEKTEAKKVYQAAVEMGHSAGHVRQVPRHANAFEVSVNVANGSAVNFTLTYQEILHRRLGAYEHEIHVNPGQAVKDFSIEVFIQENKPLKFVRTPALRTGSLITNKTEAENRLTIIDRPSSETAHIIYRPAMADQGASGISAHFVVEYDVEHSTAGDVLVVDGYFIHFFAPDLPPMPKDIVFVLDKSGSMIGEKIQQLKDAMVEILDDLQPEDRFNIITFSGEIHKWRNTLSSATVGIVEEAKQFIQSVSADGLTDINSALLAGISELKAYEDKQRIGMVFFLTDGLPTVGTTSSKKIAANILDLSGNKFAIFGLAFGSLADYDLLKTISSQNSGFARKIYVDSDAALQVASLYQEISAVSMVNISVEYLPGSVDKHTITNNNFPVIFKGSEVMISGRVADNAEVFVMEIKGTQKSGSFDLVSEFKNMTYLVMNSEANLNRFFTVPRDFSGIVEKMWAFMTIKQYLKEQEKSASNEAKVKELKNKILQISLQYKFVTPYTSMVVVKPESSNMTLESGLEDADDLLAHKPDAIYRPVYANFRPLSFGGTSHVSAFIPNTLRSSGGVKHRKANRQHNAGNGVLSSPQDPSHIVYKTGATPTLGFMKSTSHSVKSYSRPFTPAIKNTLLSAIVVSAHNLHLCMAPRKISNGTYELIRSPDGSALNIDTICSGTNCKDFLVEKFIFESSGERAEISVDETGAWKYQSGLAFKITEVASGALEISGGGLEVKIKHVLKKRSKHYLLEIKVTSVKGYSGIIGNILNKPTRQLNRWRKAKAPPVCRDKNTDMFQYLTSRMAAQYKVQ